MSPENTGNISAMAKRGYSREFTPKTERRVRFEIDRIPPTLWDRVQAKAKRQGVSLRALILTLLTKWLDEP
jgi:predicted HicB family RNase H-like nuclease